MGKNVDFLGDDPHRLAERLQLLADDLRLLAAGTLPSSRVLREAPIIWRWGFVRRDALALAGTTFGHPLIAEGSPSMTSYIFAIDPDRRWARTLSRFYVLGPAGKFGMPE